MAEPKQTWIEAWLGCPLGPFLQRTRRQDRSQVKERGDHAMRDSRYEVLNAEFTVCAVWDQLEPWHYSEISQILGIPQVPPGFFARLAPPVKSLSSDHALVGLSTKITAPDGSSVPILHTLWKRADDGHLELFFEGQASQCLPIGSAVEFIDARAGTR